MPCGEGEAARRDSDGVTGGAGYDRAARVFIVQLSQERKPSNASFAVSSCAYHPSFGSLSSSAQVLIASAGIPPWPFLPLIFSQLLAASVAAAATHSQDTPRCVLCRAQTGESESAQDLYALHPTDYPAHPCVSFMARSVTDGLQVVTISPNIPGSAPAGMNGEFSRMTIMASPETPKAPSPNDPSGVAFVKGGKRKRLSKVRISTLRALACCAHTSCFPLVARHAMPVTRANAAAMELVSSSTVPVLLDTSGFTYWPSPLQQLVGAS